MACEEQGQKVTDYHFGELEEPERQEMEAHLKECADCRAELELLEKTTAFVKEACLSSAADLPALSFDRRDELRRAAQKRQAAMEKSRDKAERGWFGRLFSLRNGAWAFSLSCACIVMIAMFTATGGQVDHLLGTVGSTLNEDGSEATMSDLQKANREAYRPKGPMAPDMSLAKKAPEKPKAALLPPSIKKPALAPVERRSMYAARGARGRIETGRGESLTFHSSTASPRTKDIVVKNLEPRTVSVSALPAPSPTMAPRKPTLHNVSSTELAVSKTLGKREALYSLEGGKRGGAVGGTLGDGTPPPPPAVPQLAQLQPAQPEPAEKGSDIDSRRRMFEAMAAEKKKTAQEGEALQELAKGYVDKLTRMTDGEKSKLKRSLHNYLIVDAERVLSKEKKEEILRDETTEESFNDRLRYFKVWQESLEKDGKSSGYSDRHYAILQNLFYTNKRKAFSRLDRSLERLGALNGITVEEPVIEDLKFISYGINPFVETSKDRFSTFAMDCDTAAYTLGRTYLRQGQLPPWQSVRVEEYVNFFDYEYDTPEEGSFAIHCEAAPSPYRKNHLLLRVGIKAREISKDQRRPARLTFVVDVSGSMSSRNRLPLVRQALKMLVDELREGDQVCIVAYGSRAKLFLDWTEATRKQSIKNKIMRLRTQGSTNAEEGLVLGYSQAAKNFSNGCDNRVILCSDGVANVGKRGPEAILKEIKKYSDKGIYLTTVGFGRGNYSDVMMERLANKGNGTYAYVDNVGEARRIFVENLTGTLVTVGKDAKIQVEFSKEAVKSYRLLGYENRDIKDEDFRNDKVDAGEVGAGHSVTALYELELSDELGSSLGTVRVRYQSPRSSRVTEVQEVLDNKCIKPSFEKASSTYRLAAVVGQLAEILRKSPYAKSRTIEELIPHVDELAKELRHDNSVQELKGLIHKVADR